MPTSFDIGLALGGVSTVIRLAQASAVKVTIMDDLPIGPGLSVQESMAVQCDGEPWLVPSGTVFNISTAGATKVLARRKDPGDGTQTTARIIISPFRIGAACLPYVSRFQHLQALLTFVHVARCAGSSE